MAPPRPRRPGRVTRDGVLKAVGAVALVGAAAALCAFALTRNSDTTLAAVAAGYTPPALAGGPQTSASPTPTPSQSPMPNPSAAPTSSPAPTRAAAAASDSPAHVVFVGDGYAAADGASDDEHGFPELVGVAEKWDVDVVSCEVAGYARTGLCGSDYAGLISKIAAARPSIVVVTGGRNDVPKAASVAASAADFFTQLAAALPGVTVYAVSPLWDDDPAPAGLGAVQQAVKTAAAAHGATYLDIGEPLLGHADLVTSDGVLPNDAGNAAIATAIEQALPAQ